MIVAHRIRLAPTSDQETYFRRACGTARFAYNWALAEWRHQHSAGGRPSEPALRRQLNAAKKNGQFPWMREVTKNAPQQAIKNLGRAYANFFEDLQKYRAGELPRNRVRLPRFKKKGRQESFRADNGPRAKHGDAVRTDGRRAKFPLIGWVRMHEEVRFAGRILSATISRRAEHWYASFSIEVPYAVDHRFDTTVVGVDLGITYLATLSDGSPPIRAPKPLRRHLSRLRRLCRALSRKQRGNNRAKARTKLARLHRRIADIRADALHKLTTSLTRYRTIVIEDLNVSGMLANRRLSRAIADVGFFEFRRQLEYKAAMAGSTIVVVDRWFPSSKRCSTPGCGRVNENLMLADRKWTCPSCGVTHCRDRNAAKNLEHAGSSPVSACGAEGAGDGHRAVVEPSV